jgi:hypothetical protein
MESKSMVIYNNEYAVFRNVAQELIKMDVSTDQKWAQLLYKSSAWSLLKIVKFVLFIPIVNDTVKRLLPIVTYLRTDEIDFKLKE